MLSVLLSILPTVRRRRSHEILHISIYSAFFYPPNIAVSELLYQVIFNVVVSRNLYWPPRSPALVLWPVKPCPWVWVGPVTYCQTNLYSKGDWLALDSIIIRLGVLAEQRKTLLKEARAVKAGAVWGVDEVNGGGKKGICNTFTNKGIFLRKRKRSQ